jgi:hypothetical protein
VTWMEALFSQAQALLPDIGLTFGDGTEPSKKPGSSFPNFPFPNPSSIQYLSSLTFLHVFAFGNLTSSLSRANQEQRLRAYTICFFSRLPHSTNYFYL